MWLQKPPLGTPLDFENPLNTELIIHLVMNEGHGDRVQDLSLNGNHGTLMNFAYPPTVASGWNPGKDGVALKFDGTGDYVDIDANDTLNLTTDGTLECVFTVVSLVGTHDIIFMKGADSASYTRMYYALKLNGGDIEGVVADHIDAQHERLGAYTIGQQHQVIMAWSRSVIRAYIDGVEVVNVAQTIYPSELAYATTLGVASDHMTYPANIIFDSARVTNRAYTAKEVLERYMNPNGVYLEG